MDNSQLLTMALLAISAAWAYGAYTNRSRTWNIKARLLDKPDVEDRVWSLMKYATHNVHTATDDGIITATLHCSKDELEKLRHALRDAGLVDLWEVRI